MIALVDIDGVLADCSQRLPWIRGIDLHGKPVAPDWDTFFNEMPTDKPITPIVKLVKVISHDYLIAYLTGRPVSHREQTVEWLRDNGLPLGMLVMRKTGDHRPDYVVKRELYEGIVIPFLGKADIVIEDRDQVVEMWRSLGLTCLQPCKGSY
jgi:hypothetical protein